MNSAPDTLIEEANTNREDLQVRELPTQVTAKPTLGTPPGVVPDGPAAPWSRIAFTQPEAWVEQDPPYYTALRSRDGAHLTQLLLVRQVHASAGKSFHSTSVRLETGIAAQQESSWSLPLDPRTQRLTLHWLRLVRDGLRLDRLQRERLQLVQRETQPEAVAVDSTWRLLAALDARPGDVVEAGYTYETIHPLRPSLCEAFFTVPSQIAVGHFRLSVLSEPSHPGLAWKASADAPAWREEQLPNGLRRWIWEGSQANPRDAEPNQPSSALNSVWVQVSDLVDYRELATRLTEVWAGTSDEAGMTEIAAFTRQEPADEASVARLIQYIQDEFRHLWVDMEASGWMPTAPGLVARRRYGASYDLVWMAVAALRHMGVLARPILVSTRLRDSVASFLPMSTFLNHALLEVELAGKKRWFDLTERAQGGDFSSQSVAWFGYGLPIGTESAGLRAQPEERARGVYAIRETILLDSRLGQGSMVEYYVRAEGWQADSLRLSRQTRGVDEFAQHRAKQARRRYGNARRVGTLHWRDDRAKNVCEFVEAFEIKDVISPATVGDQAQFNVPPTLLWKILPIPEDKPRKSPLAMPFPLEVRHEITVKAPSLTSGNKRRRTWTELGFSASLEESKVKGAWTKTVQLTVAAPEVPPERLTVYRRQLNQVLEELAWPIQLPWGQVRIHRGKNFCVLPRPQEIAVFSAPPERMEARVSTTAPVASISHAKASPRGGWRRRNDPKTIVNVSRWAWRIGGCVLVLVLLGALRTCRL